MEMFAMIVNFIFSRFQAFVSIIMSAILIQSKNRKKFQSSFFGIFPPVFYCRQTSRCQSSYKYVRIAERQQVALKEKDNLFRCLLECFAFFLKIYTHFTLKILCICRIAHLLFKKIVGAHGTVARFVQGRVHFFESGNITSSNLLCELVMKKCSVKQLIYHLWSIAFDNGFPLK